MEYLGERRYLDIVGASLNLFLFLVEMASPTGHCMYVGFSIFLLLLLQLLFLRGYLLTWDWRSRWW